MKKCPSNHPIPEELSGEDVYDMLFVFDNEEEAIEYVVRSYGCDRVAVVEELYEEDSIRQEFGKKHYLRSAAVSSSNKHLRMKDMYISELMSGEYILWIAY